MWNGRKCHLFTFIKPLFSLQFSLPCATPILLTQHVLFYLSLFHWKLQSKAQLGARETQTNALSYLWWIMYAQNRTTYRPRSSPSCKVWVKCPKAPPPYFSQYHKARSRGGGVFLGRGRDAPLRDTPSPLSSLAALCVTLEGDTVVLTPLVTATPYC